MVPRHIAERTILDHREAVRDPLLEKAPAALDGDVRVEVQEAVVRPDEPLEHFPHERRLVVGEVELGVQTD
jgi:hypothetical protein